MKRIPRPKKKAVGGFQVSLNDLIEPQNNLLAEIQQDLAARLNLKEWEDFMYGVNKGEEK